MDNFEKAIELYKAMNEAYDALPDGVYESDATKATEEAYHSALDEYGIMDSQIVDECWSY